MGKVFRALWTGDPRRGSSDGRSPSSRWEKCLGILEIRDWLVRQILLFTHPTGATGEALVLLYMNRIRFVCLSVSLSAYGKTPPREMKI